jgi:hypothetical protein
MVSATVADPSSRAQPTGKGRLPAMFEGSNAADVGRTAWSLNSAQHPRANAGRQAREIDSLAGLQLCSPSS